METIVIVYMSNGVRLSGGFEGVELAERAMRRIEANGGTIIEVR